MTRNRWFVDACLALAVIVLAVLLVDALGEPVSTPTIHQQRAATPQTDTTRRAVALPDRALFQEINARPVFLSSRRPPKPAPPRPPKPSAAILVTKPRLPPLPPLLELDGVILSSDGALALLRVPSTDHAIAAGIAQIVGGWKLVAVRADEVDLEALSTVRTVKLNHSRNTRPSSLPRGQLIGRPVNSR